MLRASTVRRRYKRGLAALTTIALVAAALTVRAPAARGPDEGIRAVKPVADAYVTATRRRENFGRAPVLRVDASPETTAYLRFELRRLRGQITSVTLLLHPTVAGGRYAVRPVEDDDWRERALTFANAPRPSAHYASSKPVRRGVWSAVDVTPFVDGGGTVTFALTSRNARQLAFGSRESRRGPRLVVRFGEDGGRITEGLTPH